MATSAIHGNAFPTEATNKPSGAGSPMISSAAPSASSSSTSSGSSDAGTITSNDFMTLLVAEMKNQDPTSNHDPNQYINQLVQVNSLEQLIKINQTLSQALGDSGSSQDSGSTSSSSSDQAPAPQGGVQVAQNASPEPVVKHAASAGSHAAGIPAGNPVVSASVPSAAADALGGQNTVAGSSQGLGSN
jgi:flagellar basal-body rod modification protein FlgD